MSERTTAELALEVVELTRQLNTQREDLLRSRLEGEELRKSLRDSITYLRRLHEELYGYREKVKGLLNLQAQQRLAEINLTNLFNEVSDHFGDTYSAEMARRE